MATVLFGVNTRSPEQGPLVNGLALNGTEALKQALVDLQDAAPRAVAGSLFREANLIVTDAKQVTPVDTGALRASGHVQLPDVQGSQVSVTMGFGGSAGVGNVGGESNDADVGYAVIVHENLSAHHPVGGAKYLETPLMEHASGMEDRLAEDLRQNRAE